MAGLMTFLVVAFRAVSIGMTIFTAISGWHAVENATNFGVGVGSPVASDLGGMLMNVVLTVLSGMSWFVKMKPEQLNTQTAIELLQKLLAGGKLQDLLPQILPQVVPAPIPVPVNPVIPRPNVNVPNVAVILQTVSTWIDADPTNDSPIDLKGSAMGFDFSIQAKPTSGVQVIPQNDAIAKILAELTGAVKNLNEKLPAAPQPAAS